MKGEVISTFRDKFHYDTIYEVGAVVDFEKERMEDLFARNLCKRIEEPDAKKKKGKKEKKTVLGDPEPKEETEKEISSDENGNVGDKEELDEKTKSEQEAADRISKAIAEQNEK